MAVTRDPLTSECLALLASVAALAVHGGVSTHERVRLAADEVQRLHPLLVHLVALAEQHLPELREAIARDPRAAHLLRVTPPPTQGEPS